ncbi:YhcN/YlaJ family sporulation lipoprotein [Peribacillus sp. SCS-155]|uniref:YhcN/YlaJ family sporulation lipoprotein n=1 Tax=Peribacillus sedimenti TaxID=3115297 RepID=UPI003905C36C
MIYPICLVCLFFVQACGNETTGEDKVHTARINSPDRYYNEDDRNNDTRSEQFGFVRLTQTTGNEHMMADSPSLDREQLADIIARLTLQLPNVDDAAALVTDEEVLIVYDNDAKDRNLIADQVKRTAASVVPSYFHIYVSDNEALMQDIENYANLGTNSRDIDESLDVTISHMLKSPQGKNKTNQD